MLPSLISLVAIFNPGCFIQLVSPVLPEGDNNTNEILRPAPPRARIAILSSGKPSKSKKTKPTDQEGSKWQQHQLSVQQASNASLESSADATRNAIMPKGVGPVTLLPSIILSSRTKYFATLLNALFASEEPFDHFLKTSSVFLDISRTAFKSVWPHLKITVETDDVLYNIVSLFILPEMR